MLASTGRAADRLGHERMRDLVEPLADASQPEVAEGCSEAIDEPGVAEQGEGHRRMRAVEQLKGAAGVRDVDPVQGDLALEQVERAVCLAPGRLWDVQRTIRHDPDPSQRITDLRVAVGGGGRQCGVR